LAQNSVSKQCKFSVTETLPKQNMSKNDDKHESAFVLKWCIASDLKTKATVSLLTIVFANKILTKTVNQKDISQKQNTT
jgi:hypothetical protein